MSDLTAGGTIDYSAIGNFTVRANSNATDIRRTVAPEPSVIGSFNINTTATGFTNAAKHLKNAETFKLNSGVLFRVVDSDQKSGHIGITQAGLVVGDSFLVEEGDEIFIPTTDLGNIFLNSEAGITFACLGE
jgi:hypothetical protein